MGNEVITGNAEPAKSSVDKNGITGIGQTNAESDFIRRRTEKLEAQMKQALTPAPEPQAQEQEESPPEPQESVPSQDDSQSEQDEPKEAQPKKKLDDLNIDELTDDDIRELAEKGKSGLLKRIAELTAKRKAAEEQLAAIKAEQGKKQEDPLKSKVQELPAEFKKLQSIEEIQAKASEVEKTIEEAEDLLWANEHMAADDVILNVEGKEYTKAQVRAVLRLNQKIRSQFLPARLSEVQESQARKTLRSQYLEQAKKELDWLGEEQNDIKMQFETLRESPVLKKAVQATPELEPYMEYMVAHAANSMFSRKPIALDSKPQVSPKPNTPPSTGAARAEQPESRLHKSLKDSESRFKTSGKEEDFIAMRAAKLANRLR
jgi:hypothetical protein